MQYVRYELLDDVARVTLMRPDQMNALNVAMHAELREALERAGREARALLLTGAGRGFCAGQDLAERGGSPSGQRPELSESIEKRYKPLILALRRLPIPTVCAVNGVAAGAGVSLALAHDVVLAGRSARFLLAFVKIGLMPDSGATFFLPRLIGHARAGALAMTGEPVSAEKAAAWGMVWECVDDDRLQDESLALARKMAAGPRLAYLRMREALERSGANTIEQQLDLERDFIGELGRTDDYLEGVAAFKEKRVPRFSGR